MTIHPEPGTTGPRALVEAAPAVALRPAPAGALPEISVVVPVLDEEATVEELAQRVAVTLDGLGREFEIIFVDDGSRDHTGRNVRAARARDPRVKLLRLRRNFGKAAALSAGFECSRGALVVTLDGDLQDEPEEIPRLLQALEVGELDLVSGWKQKRRDPLAKRLPSRLFNWATRRVAGVALHDFNCGFKVYRREVLDQVPVYGELHRYIPVLASRRGFRVGEVAVRHHPRRFGASKYGWERLVKGLLDLITVLFITRYTRRPLHLFGPIGLASMAAGGVICAYLTVLWLQGEPLSRRPLLLLGVLMILLGIQLLSTGLIAELITHRSFRRGDSYAVGEWLA